MRRRTTILIAIGTALALGLGIATVTADEGPSATPEPETVAIQTQQLSEAISLDGTLEPLTRTITYRSEVAASRTSTAKASESAPVQALSSIQPTLASVAAEDESTTSTSTTSSTTSTTIETTTSTTPPTTTATTEPPAPPPSTTTSSTTSPAQPEAPDGNRSETPPPVDGRSQLPADGAATGGAPASGDAPVTTPSAFVTGVPGVGDVIEPGDVLYTVDGKPTILLPGSAPAWRTLESGVIGPDVAQLETYLSGLGHDVGTIDDTYSATTTSAVAAWQQSLGVDDTGTLVLGDVVFAPGSVTVTAVHVSVGDDIAGGDPVLDVAGTELQATLTVEPEHVGLVQPGQQFELSIRGGSSVTGIIASVVANPRGGAIAVASLTEQPDIAVAPIDITARREAVAADTVLTIPATALVKLDRGGYAVRSDTGALVDVEVVASSGSTVAIQSTKLQAGDLVRSP